MLQTIKYSDYKAQIPESGKHILAQQTDDQILVYQAFNPRIADYAVAEQREKLKMMNKKELYELLDSHKTIDGLIEFVKHSDLKDSAYNLSESGINSFGYQLMAEERNEGALKIFKLNTELYPDDYNTYDSYGEYLLKVGRTEEGITAYKKSLELNPKNNNAERVLKEIEK